MLPVISKPSVSKRQKAAALAVAGAVDLLQITILPALGLAYVLDDLLDLVAAVVLTAICGFKWQFILAFCIELVPFVDIFPTWLAVVLTLSTSEGESARVSVSPMRAREPSASREYEVIEGAAVTVPPVQPPRM